MKLQKLVAAVGVALSFFCATTQAQTIRFQDDDIDFLLTPGTTGTQVVPGYVAKTSGSFAVGDILVSIFEIPTYTIGGVNALPAGMELTGLAAIQLAGGTGTLADPFRFVAPTLGYNLFSPIDVAAGAAGGGATIGMWLNSTANFNLRLDFADLLATNCTSYAQCAAEATAGSLLQVDGFAGDIDEFWFSTLSILGGDSPATVAGLGATTLVATFNAAQTTFFNATGPIGSMDIPTGLACAGGDNTANPATGCVSGPTISGTITGGLGLGAGIRADGAFARSDLDAQKLLVPEPGSLALVGLALLGLGLRRRS